MTDMRVKDLKKILDGLSDEMIVVIPVIDEGDANHIYGFRKVRTAGVLICEDEDDREAICLNAAADEQDIADQVRFSGRDVGVKDVLYGVRKTCTGNCDGSCGDFDCLNTPDKEETSE